MDDKNHRNLPRDTQVNQCVGEGRDGGTGDDRSAPTAADNRAVGSPSFELPAEVDEQIEAAAFSAASKLWKEGSPHSLANLDTIITRWLQEGAVIMDAYWRSRLEDLMEKVKQDTILRLDSAIDSYKTV